jgi:hypothetical protein
MERLITYIMRNKLSWWELMRSRERKDIVLPIVLGEKKEVCVWEREREREKSLC